MAALPDSPRHKMNDRVSEQLNQKQINEKRTQDLLEQMRAKR